MKYFGKASRERNQLISTRLQSIRFRRLLENTRSIHDLLASGADKIQGEYILDRHYIVSFVQKVLEKIGSVVFDASVLVPKGHARLFQYYDDQKKIVHHHFINRNGKKIFRNSPGYPSDLLQEPEYRMLADALSWLAGPKNDEYQTVLEFLSQTVSWVVDNLDQMWNDNLARLYATRLMTPGFGRILGIVENRGAAQKHPFQKKTMKDLNCRPLGLLLMDTENKTTEVSENNPRWFAVVTDEHLSLRSNDFAGGIRVETTISGYSGKDYIFVCAKKSTDTGQLLPENFVIEKTDYGTIGWSYKAPLSRMEDNLKDLGCRLFELAVG